MKLFDFLKAAQIGFHALHQRIHLFKRAAIGQIGIGVKHHFFVAGEIAALVHLLHKEAQTASQSLVYNRFHRLLISRRTENLIIKRFPSALSFQFIGQQENRQTEAEKQQQAHRPTPTAKKPDKDGIETREIDRKTFLKRKQKNEGTRERTLTASPASSPLPCQLDLLNHGRNKEQRHHQGYCQIDNHHCREILQIEPYLLIQKENDDQRPHCGKRSRQYRHKSLQVAPVQDMVGHHNRTIYHQIQRNSDSSQRIQLHLQSEKIIENKRHRNVHRQTGDNQKEIFQLARNEPYKHKQNQHRQPGTEINLVQLLPDVFGSIITGMYFIADGKHPANLIHLVHDRPAQLQLVGRLLRSNGKVNRVQPIDAEITLRRLFHAHHRHQLVQTEQLSSGSSHRDRSRVESIGIIFGNQYQTYPLLTTLAGIHIVCPQKLFPVVPPHSLADVCQGDTQHAQLLAVVFQPPFHRSGSTELYLINARQRCQPRLDMLLGILLNQYRSGRGIQRKGQERT